MVEENKAAAAGTREGMKELLECDGDLDGEGDAAAGGEGDPTAMKMTAVLLPEEKRAMEGRR